MCIYVFLSLSELRFSDYFFKFIPRSVAAAVVAFQVSACWCFYCRFLSSVFQGLFFGQLIASSIVVFHAYASIFFSLIIYLVFSPSLFQVCIVRYQFYLCCNFGARMCLLLVYFLLYKVGGSRQNFSLFFYEFHSYVVSIALADTFLAVRYTNADCLV